MTADITINIHTTPPAYTPATTGWQAWWEGTGDWDGNRLYADLDAARHSVAVDYVNEEYSWHPAYDDAADAPDVVLTWTYANDRWNLLADGRDTEIQLYPTD